MEYVVEKVVLGVVLRNGKNEDGSKTVSVSAALRDCRYEGVLPPMTCKRDTLQPNG